MDKHSQNGERHRQVSGEVEYVFKASPALQILKLPDVPGQVAQSAYSDGTSGGDHQIKSSASAWRWPVAVIASTAIATAGFLYYKATLGSPVASGGQSASVSTAEETPSNAATAGTQAGVQDRADNDDLREQATTTPETAAGTQPAVTNQASNANSAKVDSKPQLVKKASKPKNAGESASAAGQQATAPAAAAVAEPAESAAKAKPSGKPDELDSLIDNAIGGEKPKAKPSAGEAVMPSAGTEGSDATLSSEQIRAGFQKVSGKIQSCYDKFQQAGVATVKVTIAGDGTVSSATVKGKFFGTDTGTCVAESVKSAKFDAFGGKVMTLSYPFQLHP